MIVDLKSRVQILMSTNKTSVVKNMWLIDVCGGWGSIVGGEGSFSVERGVGVRVRVRRSGEKNVFFSFD